MISFSWIHSASRVGNRAASRGTSRRWLQPLRSRKGPGSRDRSAAGHDSRRRPIPSARASDVPSERRSGSCGGRSPPPSAFRSIPTYRGCTPDRYRRIEGAGLPAHRSGLRPTRRTRPGRAIRRRSHEARQQGPRRATRRSARARRSASDVAVGGDVGGAGRGSCCVQRHIGRPGTHRAVKRNDRLETLL